MTSENDRANANAPEGFDWDHATVKLVIEKVTAVKRKVTADDCERSKTLRQIAEYYAANYTGTFEPMLRLRAAIDRYGKFAYPNQFASAINCMMSDYRYRANRPATKALPIESLPDLPAEIAANRADQKPTNRTERTVNTTCAWCNTVSACLYNEALEPVCVDRAACSMRAQNLKLSSAYTQKLTEDFTAAQVAIEQQIAREAPTTIEPKCKNGTYTIVLSENGEYRTLRLTDCPESYGKPQGTQIAAFLSGSDNESNYTGFAFVSGDRFGVWARFKADSKLATALRALLAADKESQIDMGHAYALESNNCFVCGRKLTVPASIHRGMGPICANKY